MSLFSSFSKTFRGQKIKPKASRPIKVKKTPQASKPSKFDAVKARTILAEAQAKAREITLEAKANALKIREQTEQQLSRLRQEVDQKTRNIVEQEAVLKQKKQHTEEKLQEVNQKHQQVETKLQEVEQLKKDRLEKLEKLASLTRDEAKKIILDELGKELSQEQAKLIKEAEAQASEEAENKAKDILVEAMKYGATDYVAEYTVSSVKLPDEDIKGRIIGKEGRNIRAFERATNVDVDLDETPGEVRISSFDPIRREIACMALRRLVADGRIQPSRIEEYVQKAKREISRITFEEGKRLAHSIGVYNLPRELLEILGKFKFRFSYGQNMIAHTLEETKIGIALAQEVNANVDTVRLGCLLHDIGKVITDEEGSHVDLGVKLLKKFHLPQVVIDCVAQHHEDIPFSSNEAVLVYIADAISGARPGARYEDYEEYVKRLQKLEEIAQGFAGVQEAYAIQAGREVRVIVKPKEISDSQIVKLAHSIKTKVQKELTYPGTVKVSVIREVRASEIAT